MNNSDKRFETIYKQKGFGESVSILKDKETGVCYLYKNDGYAGGLTVLIDSEGKPVVK